VSILATNDARPALPAARTVHLGERGDLVVREVAGPPGAPVVILLHGWSVTADLNWFTVFDALGARYRVIAFDHRGHGGGLRTKGRFRLDDCADDVAAVADALGIEHFSIVGYSMGGPIGMLTWLRHRARVDALVLCATGCRFADSRSVRTQLATLRPASWLARALPSRAGRALLRKAIAVRTSGRDLHPWIIHEIERGDLRPVLEAGTALRRFDSRNWVTAIGVPVSVVVLDNDTVLPTRLQNELVASLREPHTFHLAGDHDVCVRHPEAFAAVLLAACAAAVPASVEPLEPTAAR
jgi:pimeloyl-ACP methyl ester carboxylesterase